MEQNTAQTIEATQGSGAGSVSGKPNWRRRNYLINPEFQLTVLGFFIGLAVVSILVFYWAVHLVFGNFSDQAKEMGLPAGHILFQFIAEQQHAMNLIFGTTSILLFAFLTLGGLILSHHIAGPVYRLKKHIQQVVKEDEFRDLSFRKKDFFIDIVPDYNELIAKIRRLKKGE